MTLLYIPLLAVALAQEPAVDDFGPGPSGPPGPVPELAEVDALTLKLSAKLRCPVCQGMSVADSPSHTAVEMKNRIREFVAAGYTEDQIVDYFVSRYGEWVLLKPSYGDHWAVWLVPGLVLGLGLAWVASTVVQWRKEPEPLPSDLGTLPKDDYEQRLLKEIDD